MVLQNLSYLMTLKTYLSSSNTGKPTIIEYTSTFPNMTVKIDSQFKACALLVKNSELICHTGKNSPAFRPEIVDLYIEQDKSTVKKYLLHLIHSAPFFFFFFFSGTRKIRLFRSLLSSSHSNLLLLLTDDTNRLKEFLREKIAKRKMQIHPAHKPLD